MLCETELARLLLYSERKGESQAERFNSLFDKKQIGIVTHRAPVHVTSDRCGLVLGYRKFTAKMTIFAGKPFDMKAANLNFNIIDSYLGLLKNLSPARKLELISKLSETLKGSNKPTSKSLGELYGAFISRKSADEIITDLKSGRNFNRNTEGL